MRLVIVDTNVLIAGLLIQDVNSPTSCVLDGMLRGAVMYVLSTALLGEYREVSLRPKIKRLHGLSENEIDAVLTEITANAIWRDPVAQSEAPDSGDNHLWSLLEESPDAVLVIGDRLLLDEPYAEGRVISPAEFLADSR